MIRRSAALLLLACAFAAAQTAPRGTDPKSRAAEYPAHARAGNLAIGAEYLVHSFSGGGRTFVAEDYLTVEVALYPPRGETVQVSSGNFSLRVNGKKQVILPQAPGFVAASLKYPDWTYRPRLEAGGGIGDTGVILGRPQPTERFPGDPSGRTRLPNPPRAPEPDDRSGIEKTPAPTADVVAVESSLPEGPARGPVSGFLFFAFKGKTRSIKTLELLYAGSEGPATLLVSPAAAAPSKPFYLRDGERVLFLGDSITQAGAYVEYIEAALLVRFPSERYDVIRLGLSSETVSGLTEPGHPYPRPDLHERLDRALVMTRPQVVSACYGMNDGIYHPFGEQRFQAYQAGIRKLIEKVRAAGARLVLLTPPPFDPLPKKDAAVGPGAAQYGYQAPYRSYDDVLERYGQWLLTLRAPDLSAVDLHAPMVRYASERRKTVAGYTLARDGVHPGAAGHWLMARAVLDAWNLPEGTASTTLDWKRRARSNALEFEWESPVPLPLDPRWSGETEILRDMAERLGRYRLTVSGAPRRVRILEGGTLVGEADAAALAGGLDLLQYEKLSTNRRAAQVLELVQKRWQVLGPAWLAAVGHSRAQKAMPLEEAQRQAGALLDQARALAQPVRLQLRLEAAQ